MTEKHFVDTNVLIYAFDAADPDKMRVASALVASLMRDGTGVISCQVLAEFYTTATREVRRPKTPEDVAGLIRQFDAFTIQPIDYLTVQTAIDLHRTHAISYWDAQIVASAAGAGCTTLYTEDLHAGRNLLGVEIVNPFGG